MDPNASCPTCKARIVMNEPPPNRDPSASNEAWLCMCCPVPICVACYVRHNEAEHPGLYRLKITSSPRKIEP
jgi:hypothetical protein